LQAFVVPGLKKATLINQDCIWPITLAEYLLKMTLIVNLFFVISRPGTTLERKEKLMSSTLNLLPLLVVATTINLDLSDLVWWLLIGLLAGWLAHLIMKRRSSLLSYLVFGIIGALLGGYVLGLLGIYTYGTLGTVIAATLGAVIVIGLLQGLEPLWRRSFSTKPRHRTNSPKRRRHSRRRRRSYSD
jgi:uncharacterized membrane protein YeaQ/YmgE (transglycosylase-associated protein family)